MDYARMAAMSLLFIMFMAFISSAQEEAHDCTSLKGLGDRTKNLPPVSQRDMIFACADIEESIKNLDQLDKDFLFMRASNLSLDALKNIATETSPPKKYGEFIPANKLKRLKQLVDAYFEVPKGADTAKGQSASRPEPGQKVATAPRPPESTSESRTYTEPSTGMKFVFIKGGCYQMGDTFGDGYYTEMPVHEVCVDDFYIGQYEVTQGQWQAVMGNNPSNFKNCGSNCPVEQVSWNDVQEYVNRLNSRSGENKYRLPTEAEWEYAARSGGKSEKYSGGNDVDSVSWDYVNSDDMTHQVGTKSPNGLGIYNMSGNVWEWVQDWSGDYSSGSQDNPRGPSSGTVRVIRGGSWSNDAWSTRSAFRGADVPDSRDGNLGFRLARTK